MICSKIELYENRHDVTLTTYIIEDSPEILNGKKRPGILILPGGANLMCSDREAESVALRFAGMGYHTFVLRYSVYKGGNLFKLRRATREIDSNSLFPNPTLDVGAAWLYIRDHSESWHVDMDCMAVCGFSAGGHNALMYCTHWNNDIMTSKFHRPADDFKPAAAIIGYGYGDYNLTRPDNTDRSGLETMMDIANFGTPHPTREMMAKASPSTMVTEQTPPMFLWTTADDQMVSSIETLVMAKALAEKKIPYEVHIFEHGPHALSLADQSCAGSADQLNPEVAQWTDLAQRWLLRRMPIRF